MKNTLSLNQNTLFKRLYYRGKSFHSQYVVIHIMKNNLPYNRLGLTVGKKIGNAVKRNRVRRLIYESYRLNEENVKIGYDIVFVARAMCEGKNFNSVSRSVFNLLKRAELLTNKNEK